MKWLSGFLVGWLAGFLVVWLAGWLVGWLARVPLLRVKEGGDSESDFVHEMLERQGAERCGRGGI